MSSRLARHVLIPLLAPLAIVGLYFTPVELIGCANRGLGHYRSAAEHGVAHRMDCDQ